MFLDKNPVAVLHGALKILFGLERVLVWSIDEGSEFQYF